MQDDDLRELLRHTHTLSVLLHGSISSLLQQVHAAITCRRGAHVEVLHESRGLDCSNLQPACSGLTATRCNPPRTLSTASGT